MTLFLIRRHFDHEGDRLAFTAATLEGALSAAESFTKEDQNSDWISVLAVAPGAGAGVEVARWKGSWVADTMERRWERAL